MIGVMVHHKIKEALDQEIAVIVPVSSQDSARSEWKLLLTQERLRNSTAVYHDPVAIKWKVSLKIISIPFLNKDDN